MALGGNQHSSTRFYHKYNYLKIMQMAKWVGENSSQGYTKGLFLVM